MSTRGYTPAVLFDVGIFPVNIGLAVTCLYLLAEVKPGQERSRRNAVLSLYTVLVAGLALASVLWDGFSFVNYVHNVTSDCVNTTQNLRGLFREQMLTEVLPFILWSVETFMLWRVYVCFRDFNQFLLGLLFAPLAGVSIWAGCVVVLGRYGLDYSFEAIYHIVSFSTAAINLVMSGAIAVRLIQTGATASQVFVHSGALFTANALLTAAFYSIRGWMSFAIIVMPQVAVLSSLLIVYQIAREDQGAIRLGSEHSSIIPELESHA